MEATAPKRVKIETIKPNEKNPRFIRDEKYKKLLASISAFPDMLLARPIIVDEYGVILGGNMRWRAAKELGHTHVNVVVVKGWTEEQKQEFVVKDNASFGEWDFDILSSLFSSDLLSEWGVDIPEWYSKAELEIDLKEFEQDGNTEESGKTVVKLEFTTDQYTIFNERVSASGKAKEEFVMELISKHSQ